VPRVDEAASPLDAATPAESERRKVTVLFADICGFTPLSESLDPEEVTNLVNACLSRLAEVVVKYEGYVDKFIGDCVMALFGAPHSHENDPELAVLAALEMIKVTEELNRDLPVKLDRPLTVHIGINTGMVIAGLVGTGKKTDYTVMGDTVNLASRLEAKAERMQILLSGYTYSLTRDRFEFLPRDPIKLKGKKDSVAIYQVLRELGERRSADHTADSAPLVGRKMEIDIIAGCYRRFKEGMGQAVLMVSEAGIGKSRLQEESQRQLAGMKMRMIAAACRSYTRSTSYHVFVEILRALFDIDSDDTLDTIGAKMAQGVQDTLGLSRLDDEAREAVVLMGLFFGCRLGANYGVPSELMSALEIKTATFRAVSRFFERLSERQPIVLLLEDMHYADATSVELITHLFKVVLDAPIFMLLLMRPVKSRPAQKLQPIAKRALAGQCTVITFSHLNNDECDLLTRHMLKSENVAEPVLRLVRDRSKGNPLFIKEVVRNLMEEGIVQHDEKNGVKVTKPLERVAIPATLHGLITARIDRLPSDLKEVLNVASVLGGSFRHELIRPLLPAADLDERLERLVEYNFFYESQSFPKAEYSFQNTMVQEVVYTTMLRKKRRNLHRRAGECIETVYAGNLYEQYELLAHEFCLAGAYDKAFEYSVKSGIKAKEAFANANAAEHFSRALEIAERERTTSPSVPLGDLFVHLSEVYELQGQMNEAIAYRERILPASDDAFVRAESLRQVGRIREKQGDREKALAAYHQAIDLLAEHPDSIEMGLVLMNKSWVMNRMHKSDEALALGRQALDIFKRRDSVQNIAMAYNNLAVFHEHSGDLDTALDFNHRSLELFTQLKDKRRTANLQLSLGYVYNKRGDLETALEYFNRSSELMAVTGNRYGSGTALMAKGRACMDLERFDESEETLLQALRIHRELDLSKKVAANELALGKTFLRQGKLDAARKHLQQGAEVAEEEHYLSDQAKIAHVEGRVLEAIGESPLENYRLALDLFQQLGRDKEVEAVRNDIARFNDA